MADIETSYENAKTWVKNKAEQIVPASVLRAARAHGLYPQIAWQEVIELDPVTTKNPQANSIIKDALNQWQSTNAAQELFSELKDRQAQLPPNPQWQQTSAPQVLSPQQQQTYMQDQSRILARRTEPTKIFLHVRTPEDPSMFTAVEAGAYHASSHIIALNPPMIAAPHNAAPKLVNGNKTVLNESIIEVLQHETRHASDRLNYRLGGSDNAPVIYTTECMEKRGVEAEQALQHELKLPVRYAYDDPIYKLENARMDGVSNQLHRNTPLTAQAYQDLKTQLMTFVHNDVIGCSAEPVSLEPRKTDADVEKAAVNAMQAYGLHVSDINIIMPSATPAPAQSQQRKGKAK